jgi:Uma2 family endonuclease
LDERVRGWLNWGVPLVWVLDPFARQVHIFEKGRADQVLGERQTLTGGSALSSFHMVVSDLFKEPGWWK